MAIVELPHIFPVTSHTDHVGIGSTFVAVQGVKENGLAYIPLALERGATTIVIDEQAELSEDIKRLIEEKNAHVTKADNTRRALSILSAQALGHPAQKLKILAITGTKGKTTTTFLVEHILRAAGYKVALLSSVRNSIDGQIYQTTLTTQQPDYLHVFFDTCVKQSVEYVVMEVSAQAYNLERVYGLAWHGFIFTNFSLEHGEFYASMDDYFAAKRALLTMTADNAPVIINADDQWLQKVIQQHHHTFSHANVAEFCMRVVQDSKDGIAVSVRYHDQEQIYICPTLIGSYNAYNITAAIGLCLKLGIAPEIISRTLMTFGGVPGRLERYILPNSALCIIDLANNPAAFKALLPTLKTMTDHLIVVFGCGGDRDATRRPIMGEIAAAHADHVILTTDNPRSEKVEDIVAQIMAGIPEKYRAHVSIELDREKAIHQAYCKSTSKTIIALLGKGAEQYQLANGVKIHFSEREIVQALK